MKGFGVAQKLIGRDACSDRGCYTGEQILHLAIHDIFPDPLQARRIFELDKLRELADSIAECGILSPLIVRRVEGGYQLIAGERRLRAASMAGFTHVPCLLKRTGGEQAAYLALVENLQRCDLDCFEEAAGLARLIADYGITQEEVARRIGKSPSAVANKLRLLRFDGDIISRMRAAGLSERHARALLRLSGNDAIRAAIDRIAANHLSVAETEAYVAACLAPPPTRTRKTTPLIRDVRLFLNTVQNALKTMTASGLSAEVEQTESEDGITLVIRLPKNR